MPTIGVDCEIILDGVGYFVKPGSYRMTQPRIRRASVRADGGEGYVDLGPGRRTWSMTILCLNDLVGYDGQPTGLSGQSYRDALRTSYLSSTGRTLLFSEPTGGAPIAVHFDYYAESACDLHTQQVPLSSGAPGGLSYEVTIELVEA
ncbi:MAG: hypothetical protein IMW90_03975 [Thermogemmatispora sp.]|jgi:hypothetical protein|uniref:Uncharacterized protein n=1 Tax=Thermogemmatispora aurantia TaxID=2045279 RepID=A0A5J4K310_9CHLR|nr:MULTISPECIES: hypothetical protein [Thermogemmatispora]MBE3564868.1 hypothetical protein [Thermogemmatispora sp.]GER82025.1 hypothetical protein KTAU_06630 [Thermogemmatispora aurantia]